MLQLSSLLHLQASLLFLFIAKVRGQKNKKQKVFLCSNFNPCLHLQASLFLFLFIALSASLTHLSLTSHSPLTHLSASLTHSPSHMLSLTLKYIYDFFGWIQKKYAMTRTCGGFKQKIKIFIWTTPPHTLLLNEWELINSLINNTGVVGLENTGCTWPIHAADLRARIFPLLQVLVLFFFLTQNMSKYQVQASSFYVRSNLNLAHKILSPICNVTKSVWDLIWTSEVLILSPICNVTKSVLNSSNLIFFM